MAKTTELVERLRELPRDTRKATVEIYDLCVEASYEIEELVDRCARYAEEIAVLRERQRWIPVTERLPEDSVKECIIGGVMERLTKHSKQTSHENGICCTHFCGPECLEVGGNCAMNCKWEEAAWNRLAAYEDTGLMPDEVSALVKDWSDLCTIVGECGGIDRLRELAEADKDERVVVLPVKPVLTPIISSMLFIIEDGDIYEDALYEAVVGMSESGKTNVVYTTLSAQMIFEQADIGKTVFLAHEEAEKALEAMRNGETEHA